MGWKIMKSVARISSLFLLFIILFSFPIFQIESQQPERAGTPEIIFMGKEETKWMEKREIPLPVLMAQGVKEEPHIGSFDLGEESIGPTQKMSPSTTQPGCAYTSKLTRGVTRVVKGDKALYERGRNYYYHRDFEEAFETFHFANDVERIHAALYSKALEDLGKNEVVDYYVCPVCGNTVEKLLLFNGHLLRSLSRPFMFISDEMENPVDHQKGDHFHFIQTKSFLPGADKDIIMRSPAIY
jgi:hypothetical protein